MDTATADRLLRAIRDGGQSSPEQVAAAERAVAVAGGDDAQLAEKLAAAGVVSPYQYRKLRSGRAADLMFGPYLILDKIAEGGMGKVYKATEPGARRVLALKIMLAKLAGDKLVLKRYRREADAVRALDHPNIVALFDADEIGGRYYLAMEYVDGLDLGRMVRQFGTPPAAGLPQYQEACEYIRQGALGLAAAHARGLVHRDVKPSNLVVCGTRALPGVKGNALVKILDLGLVRALDDDDVVSRGELTRFGTVVGTPDYMSPEQARNSSTVDGRADLYSLGCTLFFLLRGQPPFPDGNSIDKLLRHQLDAPPDLRRFRPDVPGALIEVVERLMQKKPEDRYQTAAEVAAALIPFTPNAAPAPAAAPAAAPARPTHPDDEYPELDAPPAPAPPAPADDGLELAAVHPPPPAEAPPPAAGAPRLRVVLRPLAAPPANLPETPVESPAVPVAPVARPTRPLTAARTDPEPRPAVKPPARKRSKPRPARRPEKEGWPLYLTLSAVAAVLVILAVAAAFIFMK